MHLMPFVLYMYGDLAFTDSIVAWTIKVLKLLTICLLLEICFNLFDFSVRSGQVHNVESARISMVGQLVR